MIWANCLRLSAFVAVIWAHTAPAEVGVRGTVAAVQVSADEVPIAEVLTALGNDFAVRYRASVSLDATISGTYQGSLPQVLSRLLHGYDFVLKKEAEAIEVVIVGRWADRAVAAQSPKSPSGSNAATNWRTMTERVDPAR
jgi:hypothetical protein